MRRLLVGLAWSVTAAVVAAACGSSDKTITRPEEGGAGGEAGRPSPNTGGSQSIGGKSPIIPGGQGGAGEGGAALSAPGGAAGESANGGAAGEGGVPSEPPGGAGGVVSEGGAGGAAPATQTVVDLGFDGTNTLPANLDPGTAVLTPSQGYENLGPDGDKFGTTFLRGPTGTVITLTLTDLPPHSSLSLSMLFAAIDSLDGTGTFPAGDFFKITLDGNIVFRESFANATLDQIQSYNPPAAAVLARHVDLGFSGPGGYYTDSAYDFGQDPQFQNWPHTASSAVLVFTLEGEGVQSVDDESWAIDNVRVTASP